MLADPMVAAQVERALQEGVPGVLRQKLTRLYEVVEPIAMKGGITGEALDHLARAVAFMLVIQRDLEQIEQQPPAEAAERDAQLHETATLLKALRREVEGHAAHSCRRPGGGARRWRDTALKLSHSPTADRAAHPSPSAVSRRLDRVLEAFVLSQVVIERHSLNPNERVVV